MSAAQPSIFFVTGETSGDLIGARLVRALRRRCGPALTIAGIGGPAMAAEGLDSLFDPADLSLMGVAEVLPHLPRLWRRRRQTVAAIRRLAPDAVIGIDASGFFRAVARSLRRQGDPAARILYKAPQAWAYWPWRARGLAALYDAVIALLPFEPAFFARYGVAARFVGHPAVDAAIGSHDRTRRRTFGVAEGAPLLVVLPGSRRSEVGYLLPVFGEVVRRLAASHPAMNVVVPTVAPVADAVRAAIAGWGVPARVVDGEAERYAAFRAADLALAASGTVTTELAIAGTPMVVAYRLTPISGWLGYRFLTIRHVSIVNLVLDREVVPEFLQERCTPDLIAPALARLIDDPAAAAAQRAGLAEAVARLQPPGGGSVSDEAAGIILEVIRRRPDAPRAPPIRPSAG